MLRFGIDDVLYSNNYCLCQYIENVECIKHLHHSAEIVVAIKGELTVTLSDKDVILSEGEGIYIMPFQTHGFVTETKSETAIITFSVDLIEEFASLTAEKEAEKSVFKATDELLMLCTNFDYDKNIDKFRCKTLLYPLCFKVLESCDFKPCEKKKISTFHEVLEYVVKNFKEDISLESTAHYFGLNHKYLSHMFKSASGMCFSDYLSGLRCTYVLDVFSDYSKDEMNLSEIAFEAGFNSIRSFNRIFKKIYAVTPGEARNYISNNR